MLNDFSALTIYEVEEIKPLLEELLQTDSPITLNMQPIEKIDMVGVQLLISFVKSAHQLDKKTTFNNLNETLIQFIEACNCTKALGL